MRHDDDSAENRGGDRGRVHHAGSAVRRFRYCADPLFLGACTLYALNRWGLQPCTDLSFFHSWFDDLLLIPCALPPVLALHRRWGLRAHDRPPTAGEILGHLVLWSVLCEWIGPAIVPGTVGDWWDVAAYACGALLAALWWHRPLRRPVPSRQPAAEKGTRLAPSSPQEPVDAYPSPGC